MRPGRSDVAAGCSTVREQLLSGCSSSCSSPPGRCTPLGGAKAYSEEELPHGGEPVGVLEYIDHLAVLVRVVPELAERVPGRRRHRRRSPSTCASAAPRSPSRWPSRIPPTGAREGGTPGASGQSGMGRAMPTDQYTMTDPTKLYADIDTKQQTQPSPGLDAKLRDRADLGEDTYRGTGRLKGRKALITGRRLGHRRGDRDRLRPGGRRRRHLLPGERGDRRPADRRADQRRGSQGAAAAR